MTVIASKYATNVDSQLRKECKWQTLPQAGAPLSPKFVDLLFDHAVYQRMNTAHHGRNSVEKPILASWMIEGN